MLPLKISIALFPVLIFLFTLMMFDSFKLIRLKTVLRTIVGGGIVALVCFALNRWLISYYQIEFVTYSRYMAPVIEELIKAALIIVLIRSSNIGFMVDAAILGFAVGAGFAIIENIYHLQARTDLNLFIWILRGLGTAVMHGATTAIFAVISKYVVDRYTSLNLIFFVPGLLVAMIIHSFFNHLLIPPHLTTALQIVVLPFVFWLVFKRSENALQQWLEMGLDTEVGLLEFLTSGVIAQTRVGQYLQSLKGTFSGEIIADMICYLRLYLELSIRAKGILLMQQNGFEIELDSDIKERLDELKYLEKSIGKTGKRALAAVYRADPKELWQIFMLYNKNN